MKVLGILILFFPIYFTNASDTCWPKIQIKMNATKVYQSGKKLAVFLYENNEYTDIGKYAHNISEGAKHIRTSVKPTASCDSLKNKYTFIKMNFKELEEHLSEFNDFYEGSEVFTLFQKLDKSNTKLRKSLFNE